MTTKHTCCEKESAIAKRLLERGHSSPADGVETIVEALEGKVVQLDDISNDVARALESYIKQAEAVVRNPDDYFVADQVSDEARTVRIINETISIARRALMDARSDRLPLSSLRQISAKLKIAWEDTQNGDVMLVDNLPNEVIDML